MKAAAVIAIIAAAIALAGLACESGGGNAGYLSPYSQPPDTSSHFRPALPEDLASGWVRISPTPAPMTPSASPSCTPVADATP